MLSWIGKKLFNDATIDVIKVKHLKITSMNTLTTPKIALSNAGADPASNGEIKMNSTTIKGENSSSGVRLF